MFLQFSPIRPEKKPEKVPKDPAQEFETLSLAPFSPMPKLFFDNVTVGTTSVQRLLIKNSTSQEVTLCVNTSIPSEFQVTINWDCTTIEKGSETFFEIAWTPHVELTGRYSITFEDFKRIKRDVPIAFKSIVPIPKKGAKGKAVKKRKSPTKRVYFTKPPHISPRRMSPSKIALTPKSYALKTSRWDSTYASKGQENVPVALPPIPIAHVDHFDSNGFTSSRRETYVIAKKEDEFYDSLVYDDDTFKLPGIESGVCNRKPLQFHQADNLQIGHTSPNIEFKMKLLQRQFSSPADSPFLARTSSYSTSQQNHWESVTRTTILEETSLDEASFTTYVKHNDTQETYTISPSLDKFSASSPSIPISPLFPPKGDRSGSSYEGTWSPRSPLDPISEESHFQMLCRKRKSTLDFDCVDEDVAASSKKANYSFEDEQPRVRVLKRTSETTSRRITIRDPCLFAADGAVVDPFMSPDLQVDPEWVGRQEENFKKWLNALLTPPAGLAYVEQQVDVSKVWQEIKTREVPVAPTKEAVSSRYHTSDRLSALRKAAMELYGSPRIADVLAKVFQQIDKGKLTVREDRFVHLNVAIRSQIITLILSYNPLWLRLGLETIYKKVIVLNSNSDIVGLTTFIVNHLLKDPSLIKKHKTMHTPNYTLDFNKFFLKKILALVYFLDKAKNLKLIPHDPCLFNKNSTIKASKDLLFALAREIVSSIGDITKYLKHYDYHVDYSQTYIHEFDYAVNNIRSDLRDGVRLTRVTEIVLLRDDLVNNLRVPAVSLLQKVHNLKIVFKAYQEAGFEVLHDITPKDIAIGIREKTLSLLWQIIYKFETPLMVKSATSIQRWYRSLPVVLRRRRLERRRRLIVDAAVTLQRWFRRRKLIAKLLLFRDVFVRWRELQKTEGAVVTIQSYYRMYRERKTFLRLKKTTILLQARCRGWIIRNIIFKNQQNLICAVKMIQQRFRATLEMKRQRSYYLRLKSANIFVQRLYRAKKAAELERRRYLELKTAVTVIQARFRANLAMKFAREHFVELRAATVKIQLRYRAQLEMRKCRDYYLSLKNAVRIIEERRKAHILMLSARNEYVRQRTAAVKIQRWFRAIQAMQIQRTRYINLRHACLFLQRKFRANRLAKSEREHYLSLRRAAIVLQQRFRAKQSMNITRASFISLKTAAVLIQARYRATTQMKRQRASYRLMLGAAVKIQTFFRARLAVRKDRESYLKFRQTVLMVQRRWRANRLCRIVRNEFVTLREKVIQVQVRFRAILLGCRERKRFLMIKNVAVKIQRKFRGILEGRKCRMEYLRKREAIVKIQTLWRGYKCRRELNELQEVRQRLQQAYRNYDERQTLRHQTDKMLQVLCTGCAPVDQVFKILIFIDKAIKSSKELICSVSYVLPETLYIMLSKTARSDPEMQICILSVNILLTFHNYPPSRNSTFIPEYLNSLLTLMLHWCDKESILFPSVSTLLWMFAHNPAWKQEILKVPKFDQLFQRIGQSITRKATMVKNVPPKSISFFTPYKNLPLPSWQPDWGLKSTKKNPNVFQNSVQAYMILSKILKG